MARIPPTSQHQHPLQGGGRRPTLTGHAGLLLAGELVRRLEPENGIDWYPSADRS